MLRHILICEMLFASSALDLFPIGLGQYNGLPAVFLAKSGRLNPRSEVLPLPLVDEGAVNLLRECFSAQPLEKVSLFASGKIVVNRDDGIFDNMPWSEWGDAGELCKRKAFNRMTMGWTGGQYEALFSAYGLFAVCLLELCRSKVVRVVVEEERFRAAEDDDLCLGGAVELCQEPKMASLMGEEFPVPFSGGAREIAEVFIDEAIGIATVCGLPIVVEEALWDQASVRPSYELNTDGRMLLNVSMQGPTRSSSTESRRRLVNVPRPAEIRSVAQFMALDAAQKSSSLRLVGIKPPRPRIARKNPSMLDDLLLPLLDEAVRREVLMQKAINDGDWEMLQTLSDKKSKRGRIRDAIEKAKRIGDQKAVAELWQQLDQLTSARADATQDEGSYDRFLDADEWYVEQRRRAMGLGGRDDNESEK
jgi:hypothetical protein